MRYFTELETAQNAYDNAIARLSKCECAFEIECCELNIKRAKRQLNKMKKNPELGSALTSVYGAI